MGNLLCCGSKKASLSKNCGQKFECETYHHCKPKYRTENALPNRGQQTTTRNLVSSKKVRSDPNTQTKSRRRTATKSASGRKINGVHSSWSYKKPRQVCQSAPNNRQICHACGDIGHSTTSCRYFTRNCFYCREEGHIIRICPKLKRSSAGNRKRHYGTTFHVTSRKHNVDLHHVPRKRNTATSAPKRKPVKEYVCHLPPDVRRESWAPVGTIVTLGTIEDFADDDSLEKKSGCDDVIYLLMCCL